MNRFAAAHPDDWEERLDALTDHSDLAGGLEPCVICEALTGHGAPCPRCVASMERDLKREGGR